MTRCKNQAEFNSAQRRFWYESRSGKKISKKSWSELESKCQKSNILLNQDNVLILADIHRAAPKYFRCGEAIALIAETINKYDRFKEKLSGYELANAAINLCQIKKGFIPSNPTIYRWFAKTAIGGFREKLKAYTKSDACIILTCALLYEPKNTSK